MSFCFFRWQKEVTPRSRMCGEEDRVLQKLRVVLVLMMITSELLQFNRRSSELKQTFKSVFLDKKHVFPPVMCPP